ncbi:MAG: hypothetical protein IH600_10040 [Bacteroidetes bacterium]|nr:hypothetical protein [Bacteroidota bacterium]
MDVERAGDDEAKIRNALRGLLEKEQPFDGAQFLLSRSALLPLCFELTRLYDIPCTFDPGVPLHYSKAARTAFAWLRWLAEDYSGRHLIRMMYDGIPAPQELHFEGERGGRLQMAAMLRRAAIGAGRERLLPAVDRSLAVLRKSATEDNTALRSWRQGQANRLWLQKLLEATPSANAHGLLSLHAIAEGARTLVQHLCRDAYPGEELALARIAELMSGLQSAPDAEMKPHQAAAKVIPLLREAYFPMALQAPGSDAIPTTSPLPGHLHVAIDSHPDQTHRPATIRIGSLSDDAGQHHMQTHALQPPLSLAEWWLSACRQRDRTTVRSALLAWQPLLREGARAEAARATNDFTAWDGNCGAGSITRLPEEFRDDALHDFSRCPYSFFLEYLLEVKEPPPWRQSPDASGDVPRAEVSSPSIPEADTLRLDHSARTDPPSPSLRMAFATALAAGSFPHPDDSGTCAACPLREVCGPSASRQIPELQHLLNAMRILTDPENPLPMVAFLRGPLCGADDRALLAYRNAGGQFAFNARAIPGTDERITRGLQFIKDTVRLVRSNPPGTVIASMLERLALHAAIACSPSGWTGVAALQEVFSLVQSWSMTGSSIPEIVDRLQAAFLETTFPSSPPPEVLPRPAASPPALTMGDIDDAERKIRARFERALRPSGV